jgi:single-strand DNA-binding protein
MVAVNTAVLGGNLTRDPEVRHTPQGKAVANLGIAVNETYRTKDGEKREDTLFIDVEAWDRQAETAGQYLRKGSPVLVEGSLKLDTWTDKEGNKRSKHKVRARRIHFIGGRQEAATGGERREESDPHGGSGPYPPQVEEGDDLPPF